MCKVVVHCDCDGGGRGWLLPVAAVAGVLVFAGPLSAVAVQLFSWVVLAVQVAAIGAGTAVVGAVGYKAVQWRRRMLAARAVPAPVQPAGRPRVIRATVHRLDRMPSARRDDEPAAHASGGGGRC